MAVATNVHTNPSLSVMARDEVREYLYDATRDLGTGQAPINPAVELIDNADDSTVLGGATLDTVPVDGNVIAIRVAEVEAGHSYTLKIEFDHSAPRVTGEHTVRLHLITCV